MLRNVRSPTYFVMYFLGALSVLGFIVAFQQYVILQSEAEGLLAQRTVDETFLSAIKLAGGESNPEIAQLLGDRKTGIESIYTGAAAVNRVLEISALADTIAWCVVFAISCWALFANERKQSKSSDSPSISSEAGR